MTIDEKLEALANCGLKLKDPFGAADLAGLWDPGDLDEPGWDRLLVSLGTSEERPPWRPHCDNLWHFDSECIEGDGSYVDIAERMAAMSRGSLPLSDIRDRVDFEVDPIVQTTRARFYVMVWASSFPRGLIDLASW